MTNLKKKLIRLIGSQGPISISQFMTLCLSDPQNGYYLTQTPFGTKGDFTTAPEISQMFGEMLGLWAIDQWQIHGTPSPFIFCEMGPGRGTLMDDMLRTITQICPEFLKNTRIMLLETSQNLRRQIEAKLHRHKMNIHFIEAQAQLPPLPLILIANEFLDCLPIHQYCRTSNGYVERMVGLDSTGNLCFINGFGRIDPRLLPEVAIHAPPGTIIEISPAREACVEMVAHHLTQQGGAALFIDYGSLEPGFGDTLQALSQHQFRSPLEMPGQHDLTSHVDFSTLAQLAQRLGCDVITATQGDFLHMLGIVLRAEQLAHGRGNDAQEKLATDIERLTGEQQMGKLFKILSLARPCPPVAR